MTAIYVTRPLEPDIDELVAGIRDIYARKTLTNSGPIHQKLELALGPLLGGTDFVLFNNGTIALMAAVEAMRLPPGSEVITTPFTFAATAHAISILGLKPVFADIDPTYMTLDPASVATKITARTSAILAVHVYGFPCDVVGLQSLADAHGLKLIYDAAMIGDRPIGTFGDASAFSFHATKLFTTVEGGGISFTRPEYAKRARDYRNFGIQSEDHVAGVGLNGKMSELHALVGVLNLKKYAVESAARAGIASIYREILRDYPEVIVPEMPTTASNSNQYFPVRVANRQMVVDTLKGADIFARRYFYPLVTDFDVYKNDNRSGDFPNAVEASQECLCLPFHSGVSDSDVRRIATIVGETASTKFID